MNISAWLHDNVDSHTLYDAAALLAELPSPLSYDAASDTLMHEDGRSTRLWATAIETIRRTQGAVETGNPKGAYFNGPITAPETRAIAGYVLADAIDAFLTGEHAGASKLGRGFAFRASIAHLAEAGF